MAALLPIVLSDGLVCTQPVAFGRKMLAAGFTPDQVDEWWYLHSVSSGKTLRNEVEKRRN